jgi:two-component system, chemotaxis family, sensor kinase CheA
VCVEKGIISAQEASAMSDHDLQMLVFRPAVSTAKTVTSVSGRGVGMNAVLQKVRELGGSLELVSQPGKGTCVMLRLPFTVAIATALLVGIDDCIYAVPSFSIDRVMHVSASTLHTVGGDRAIVDRGREMPVIGLRALLKLPDRSDETLKIIVVHKSDASVGIIVDRVITQQPVLIKRIEKFVSKGISGATILGDGKIALILDLEALL